MDCEITNSKTPGNWKEQVDGILMVEHPIPAEVNLYFESPRTDPMLLPEIWEKVFVYLSKSYLITILNTCVEWNSLLEKKKTTILLPKVLAKSMRGYITKGDFLSCRLLNKQCKVEIDEPHPDLMEESRRRQEERERNRSRKRRSIRGTLDERMLEILFKSWKPDNSLKME